MEPDSSVTDVTQNKIGIGLDSCLIPIKHNLFLIQSTDFFYPLIDDPYFMGKITCANVLSDVYATGVVDIDNLSLIISLSENMTEDERDIVMPLIIKGFKDNAASVGLQISINNATYNPWCIIGGTATSICTQFEYINPLQAIIGDVIVLTKPLGAQIACNANRWSENEERREKLCKVVTIAEIKVAFRHAVLSMARLNKNAAALMHKYKAHGATDVTGFGILGHATNLASLQSNKVKFVIHTLPVIKDVLKIADIMGSKEKFLKGRTPETSGGLLISMSRDLAENYCNELKSIEGWESWVVGVVERGENEATIIETPNIIEVECNL
ncbi:hypothetical protein Trydic_g5098 [Trypoxylus dichotomus]